MLKECSCPGAAVSQIKKDLDFSRVSLSIDANQKTFGLLLWTLVFQCNFLQKLFSLYFANVSVAVWHREKCDPSSQIICLTLRCLGWKQNIQTLVFHRCGYEPEICYQLPNPSHFLFLEMNIKFFSELWSGW